MDEVDLLGVKCDGSTVNIGKIAMPPKMKARELTREQFGHFEEGDGSDADLCFYAMEQLIEHMQAAMKPKADEYEWLTDNPPRKGVYRVKSNGAKPYEGYRYWNGEKWGPMSGTHAHCRAVKDTLRNSRITRMVLWARKVKL